MAESPADELRRTARRLRITHRTSVTGAPGERWRKALAALLEAVASEMADYRDVQECAHGVGIEYLGTFQPSRIWTAAVAAARACLPDDAPEPEPAPTPANVAGDLHLCPLPRPTLLGARQPTRLTEGSPWSSP